VNWTKLGFAHATMLTGASITFKDKYILE